MNYTEEMKCCCTEQPKKDKHTLAMLMDNAEQISVALNLATAIQNNLIGGQEEASMVVFGGNNVRSDLIQQGKALEVLVKRLEEISRTLGCWADLG